MKRLKWTVQEDRFRERTPDGRNTEFVNLMATFNPDAPRRLIVACHYDSKLEPTGFLGATDSAVPCAQMINLAHVMDTDLRFHRENGTGSDLTLQLVFFDGEEPFKRWQGKDNTYGSRHLAKEWERKGLNKGIDVLVLLDLLGAANPNIESLDSRVEGWFKKFRDIERTLTRRDRSLPQRRIFSTRSAHFTGISDDHVHFYKSGQGVPTLHLIASPFPSVWHTTRDDLSALHFPTIRKLNQILRLFVANYLGL